MLSGVITVCSVPARAALVPQPSCTTPVITARRLGTPQDSESRGLQQNGKQVGRTLPGYSYTETLGGLSGGQERQAGRQRLEHRESMKFYP